MPLEHMTFVTTLVSLARPVTIGPNQAVTASDEAVLAEAMAIARRQAQRAQLARPNLPRSPAARVTSPGAKIRADMQCQIDPNQQVPVTNEPGACVWVPEGRYKGAKRIKGTDAGPSLRLFSRRSAHLLKYACQIAGADRKMVRYQSQRAPDIALRGRLREGFKLSHECQTVLNPPAGLCHWHQGPGQQDAALLQRL